LALPVNFDIQNAHSVKHGRHAALENSSAIEFVKVFGGIYSVFFGSSSIRSGTGAGVGGGAIVCGGRGGGVLQPVSHKATVHTVQAKSEDFRKWAMA
jgi:hypothetical protein